MSNTKYTIYWTVDHEPQFKHTHDMSFAMSWMEYLRRDPKFSAITFCSENTDQVGKSGVDTIIDGVLPDGEDYTWSKAHRAGAERGIPHSIIDHKSNK